VRYLVVPGNTEGISYIVRIANWCGLGNIIGSTTSTVRINKKWIGSEGMFLGGFGSEYFYGDIDDISHNYLDRSRQIEIAVQWYHATLQMSNALSQSLLLQVRVVHVYMSVMHPLMC
jgi:hypothetical protein